MSKPFIKNKIFIEKNVYDSPTIPDTFKDQIRKLATSGNYGELKELFELNNVNVSFYEDDIKKSLLHSIIQSDLTEQQKNMVVIMLLDRGVSINILDSDNLPPIYYAIKYQLSTIVDELIKRKVNLQIALPKGYDLFTTAIIPYPKKCPTELFNIQDQGYFSKYYNQTHELERNIKKKIYDLPETADMIKYLLEFCVDLPNDCLNVYDQNTDNTMKICNTNTEDESIKQYLPPFINTVALYVKNISKIIANKLKSSNMNIDQLILLQPDLVRELNQEMGRYLEITKVKNFPDISIDKFDASKTDDDNYPLIYDFQDNSIDNFNKKIRDIYNNDLKNTIEKNIYLNDQINNLEEEEKLDIERELINNIKKYNNYINDLNNWKEVKKLNNPNPEGNFVYSYIPNNNQINSDQINIRYNQPKLTNRKIVEGSLGLNHLFIIAEIYHKKIFGKIINDPIMIINIPLIKDDEKRKIKLKIINDAIISSFNEILEIVLYRASTTIVNNTLFNNITPNDTLELKSRLKDKITFKTKEYIPKYYLNENYSNGEPIDIIQCLNNNNELILKLQQNIHIDLRQYQDLLFKLGNSELINNLNKNTSKKITKLDIINYIERHNKKFDDGIKFLNNQLDQDIQKQSLEFFENKSKKIIFDETNRQETILGKTINDIYEDMINDQKISNQYLVRELKLYLKDEFIRILIPEIKRFIEKFIDIPTNVLVNYETINTINNVLLSNIIDNIITYHLNIDPLKTKTKNMSLGEIMDVFKSSFIFNFDDPVLRQNVFTLYMEKLDEKIINYIMLVSQYALNVYRNQLRYIFNSARYEKIKVNIN